MGEAGLERIAKSPRKPHLADPRGTESGTLAERHLEELRGIWPKLTAAQQAEVLALAHRLARNGMIGDGG